MKAVHAALMRKFTDLAFDASQNAQGNENPPAEADEIDLGNIAEADFQNDLLDPSDDPF